MTPQGSRFIALGLLLMLVVVCLFAVEPLYRNYQRNVEALATHRFEIERLRAVAPRVAQAQAELAAMARRQQDAGLTVSYQAPGLALAAMQQRFRELAKQYRADVVSLASANSGAVAGFETIAIQAHLRADLPSLQRLLYAIEAGRPAALIRDLTMTKAGKRRRNSEPAGVIDARLVVVAVMEASGARASCRTPWSDPVSVGSML